MKTHLEYICSNCGLKSPKWLGRCTNCGEWDSFSEVERKSDNKRLSLSPASKPKVYKLGEIEFSSDYRISSGIKELDRVLGGGIVLGTTILVGGDPGIGKSTMMLQMVGSLVNVESLYITGEESLQQIKYRSKRLKSIPDSLQIMSETNIELIYDAIKYSGAKVIVVDSIQSSYLERIDSTAGSVLQVRECASMMMQIAKETNKAIFLIGHVTKEGFIAGPKVLEHMVDTVLQFEGDKSYSYRILRAIKNRYGSTNEIGIFDMDEEGLREVLNPSELFLAHRRDNDSGVATVSAIVGSRPILLEVQALVSTTGYSVPQRSINGMDLRRLQMILAVLEKRLGINFRQFDVFVNIAGGIYINDPAVDLGIAAALVSSYKDQPINPDTVFIGEIGLTGEVRRVSAMKQRISEAIKLGFVNMIIPKLPDGIIKQNNIKINECERISLALEKIF